MLIHKLAAFGFSTSVVLPIRIGHRVFGERIWPPLEAAAARIGTLAGAAARPLLRTIGRKTDPIDALLTFTEIVEGSLGIEGTNEVLDGQTGRRRVYHCPFAESLKGLPEFCTRLGRLAGETSSVALAPGFEYVMTSTRSQGHPYCEYIYRPISAGVGSAAR